MLFKRQRDKMSSRLTSLWIIIIIIHIKHNNNVRITNISESLLNSIKWKKINSDHFEDHRKDGGHFDCDCDCDYCHS